MPASLFPTRAQSLCGPTRAGTRAAAGPQAAPRARRFSAGVVVAGIVVDAGSALSPTSTSTARRSRGARGSVAASASAPSSSSSAPSPPASTAAAKVNKSLPPAITLTDRAVARCLELKKAKDVKELFLRVGVRSGGCNGMSYTMDFTEEVKSDDHVFEAGTSGSSSSEEGKEGEKNTASVKIVCDPKSLLFLFGLQLDYSDALIGGGFSFQNPNAEGSCGCGKSFNV